MQVLNPAHGSLEILQKSQLPPIQAHAILEAMDEEFATMERSLATKSDLDAAILRFEMKVERCQRELSEQIERGKVETMRWTVSLVFGQTAVLAGFVYFALARLK